ncbi:zinc transporter ZIP11-like isoform X6 [Cavia porcellus]|uniref:zinc transporter ZIP11-like isoform X6 n=1 Tax=Cavia porcellus TaxID=10141 RepID=UPI002FE17D0B
MRMSEPHSVNDFGAISIMLQGHSTVFQALRGTFFTWGMTAAGAALVFVFSSGQRRILDGRLGFAAGASGKLEYFVPLNSICNFACNFSVHL